MDMNKRFAAALAGCTVIVTLGGIGMSNLLDALNRSRQKQTMRGLREWGVVLETRHGRMSRTFEGKSSEMPALAQAHSLPRVDGWGNAYRIAISPRWYSVQSAGRDGIFESVETTEVVVSYDNDLVFANGSFTRYPEGI